MAHVALIAMDPRRTRHVLSEAHLARLAKVCDLPLRAPVARLDPAETLPMRDADILVTGWGCPRIDAATLAAMPRLGLIAHAAGTVKALLAPETFARGVRVSHAAAANAIPVAEFALAAILLANKQAMRIRRLYAEGRGRSEALAALIDGPIGNLGKTVGVVGASTIGRLLIERLRPFDLDVLLYDPFVGATEAAEFGVEARPLDDLLSASDVVTLHAPLLPETRGMLGGQRLALMKDGATLVNTARGALVDQAALERELVAGRLDAWIDVTDPETPPPHCPLYDLPNVVLTPHVAGAMGVERRRLGEIAVAEVERFVAGAPLRCEVDPAALHRLA